jgi:MFS family permease
MSEALTRPSKLSENPEWRAVMAAFALNGLLFGAWAARVPAFKDRFDLEPGTLGLLLLCLAAGAILSFPLAGALSEKWGASTLTVRCAWAYGPALVLLSLAPNVWTLGLALLVFGAMHGAMDVAMNGWGARVETQSARSTMSVFHALFSLGAGLGAGSGYLAVQSGMALQLHLLLVVVIGGAVGLALMQPASGSDLKARPEAESPLFALPTGRLALVGLIAFSVSMGEGAMADWSAVFLRLSVQATDAQAALGYAAFSATMVLMRLAGGYVTDRLGAVLTVRASGLIAACGLAIAIGANSLTIALAGLAITGIGYAVVMPLVFSRAARDPEVPSGPAIASVATLGYGGMLLGPPVIGFIAQLTGLPLSFVLLVLLSLLAATLSAQLRTD